MASMPKQPLSVGAFLAWIPERERLILTQAQDKLRAERSLGLGPQETIEMPLQWCQEALELYHRGQVTPCALATVLEWSLLHPNEVHSIAQVVQEQGLQLLSDKGDPATDLQALADHHAAWRETFASDPVKAVREATRAVMIAGRGKSNPVQVQQVVQAFFSEPGDTPNAPMG